MTRTRLHSTRNKKQERQLLLEQLERRELFASTPTLLRDINENRDFASIESFVKPVAVVGNVGFVALPSNEIGTELYRTDGTVEGTRLLKDIAIGPTSSNPSQLTVVGNRLYFTVTSQFGIEQLWTSDGTEAGTQAVFGSFFPGSYIRNINATDQGLFFSGPELQGLNVLYYLDAATQKITQLGSEDGSWIQPAVQASLENHLLFTAQSVATNEHNWYTVNKKTLVVERFDDIDTSRVQGIQWNKQYAWVESDTEGQLQLWLTNGTVNGTRRLATLPSNETTSSRLIGGAENRLYIATTNGATSRTSFSAIDLSGVVTPLIQASRGFSDLGFAELDSGRVLIASADVPGFAIQSDGTAAGTRILSGVGSNMYIVPSSAFTWQGQTFVQALQTNNQPVRWLRWNAGSASFIAFDLLNQYESVENVQVVGESLLWFDRRTRTLNQSNDGASVFSQTLGVDLVGPLATLNGSSIGVIATDNGLYVSTWSSIGKQQVSETYEIRTLGSGVSVDPIVAAGKTYFLSLVGSKQQLWRTDGTTAGTELIGDLEHRPDSKLLVDDSYVYVIGTNERNQKTITRFNLASEQLSTQIVSFQAEHFAISNNLMFAWNDQKLWTLDESLKETLLQDWTDSEFYIGTNGDFGSADRFAFFLYDGFDPLKGQVWTTDGTVDGTARVLSSEVLGWEDAAVLGNTIYFSTEGKLYRTSDYFVTTELLDEKSGLSKLRVVRDELYYTSTLNDYRVGLWKLEGSEPEFQIAFSPSGEFIRPVGVFEINGQVYMYGNSELTGSFTTWTWNSKSEKLVEVPQLEAFRLATSWSPLALGTKIVGVSYNDTVGEEPFSVVLEATPNDDWAPANANYELLLPVLDNDYLGPNPLDFPTARVIDAPGFGTLRWNENGDAVYQANEGFFGVDQFTYELVAEDGSSSDMAEVTIYVHSVFHNWQRPADTDGDGLVTPLDALQVVNYINENSQGTLVQDLALLEDYGWIDADGDGTASPLDALRVINQLNDSNGGMQGEGESATLWQTESTGVNGSLPVPSVDSHLFSDQFVDAKALFQLELEWMERRRRSM